ncbi:MAG: amidophosphoribosyltransferase [Alphaproteobacteria bacterium GM7ARS4]|nr:amidophosphoribosyltransferase [Alphaproteobacteria bacterium GM7ARS4]
MARTSPQEMKEKCGVFGVFDHKEASAVTALGLHALQHRGQEASGIVSCLYGVDSFHTHKALGYVGDIFSSQHVIDRLKGTMAVGHNRYSTAGASDMQNIQPLYAQLASGGVVVAHNGNLTDAHSLRRSLAKKGATFQTTSDTEIILHLMAMSGASSVQDKLVESLSQVHGAYALVVMTPSMLIGVRDPFGVRPLSIGTLESSWMLASESCAFDILGGDLWRDVEAGEMVIIDKEGVRSYRPFPSVAKRFCLFEYIYFSRPDSVVEGRSIYAIRKRVGCEMARENKVTAADVVVPIPDSGLACAIGYAQESGVPFDMGIIRNHYVGRTFIEPMENIRHFGVRLKHNAHSAVLKDKVVVLIDDSLVRGTTSRKIVAMVRRAGAREVHLRIASPHVRHPCFYGIDTPSSEELLASELDDEAIAREVGVDSIAFLSLERLYRAIHEGKETACAASSSSPKGKGFCDACFTGHYPIPLVDVGHAKSVLPLMDTPSTP